MLKWVFKATNSMEASLPTAKSIIPFLLTAMAPHTNISFAKKQKIVKEFSMVLEKKTKYQSLERFCSNFHSGMPRYNGKNTKDLQSPKFESRLSHLLIL